MKPPADPFFRPEIHETRTLQGAISSMVNLPVIIKFFRFSGRIRNWIYLDPAQKVW